MKILAIDTSGLVASVAYLEDTMLIGEFTTNHKQTHSETLMPMLQNLTKMLQQDINTIDAIAIASGPGSFTGLRIGSATAKGLGLALDVPLIPVKTVEALAYQFYGSKNLICPLMDARRNQVYTGLYEFIDEKSEQDNQVDFAFHIIKEQCAMSIFDIIDYINELGREVIFLGDGVPVYENDLKERLKVPYCLAPASHNRQRAALVGLVGIKAFQSGKAVTADDFEPDYLRLSQAERELNEKTEKTHA